MTRVAIVASTFPPSAGGGIAAAHYHLGQLLGERGCEIRYFSFMDTDPDTEIAVRRTARPETRRLIRKVVKRLFRLLDPSGAAYQTADILESYPGARQLRRAILDFAPDHLILPDHGCPGLPLGILHKHCQVTLVAHHNPMRFVGDPLLNPHSRLDAKAAVALEKLALRHVHRVVAPCRYMAATFQETYAFKGPVEVIPNLVDLDTLNALPAKNLRSMMGLQEGAPLIYVPSAGSRFKGAAFVPDLIREIGFLLKGPFGVFLSGKIDPQQMSDFTKAAQGAPLYAPGRLPAAQNLALVKTCDIAVSPTLIENFSMAFLEAQFLGLPVATFDVGGNQELIESGVTGQVVPRGDIKQLARAACELLNPPTLQAFQCAARKSSLERFNPSRWLGRWIPEASQQRIPI